MTGRIRGLLRIAGRMLASLFVAFAFAGAAFAQQPLKIGFGMSLTGPLAGNGKAALRAILGQDG